MLSIIFSMSVTFKLGHLTYLWSLETMSLKQGRSHHKFRNWRRLWGWIQRPCFTEGNWGSGTHDAPHVTQLVLCRNFMLASPCHTIFPCTEAGWQYYCLLHTSSKATTHPSTAKLTISVSDVSTKSIVYRVFFSPGVWTQGLNLLGKLSSTCLYFVSEIGSH
jgi:hypothetical protein